MKLKLGDLFGEPLPEAEVEDGGADMKFGCITKSGEVIPLVDRSDDRLFDESKWYYPHAEHSSVYLEDLKVWTTDYDEILPCEV